MILILRLRSHIRVNTTSRWINMVEIIYEMTIFYKCGGTQTFTGSYDVHDTYISIEVQDEKNRKVWHNVIVPMHEISGFEAHNQPKPLYMLST